MGLFRRVKLTIENWLARLAKENAKTFNGAGLDCCGLNRRSNTGGTTYDGKHQK
ncbi:MAG: hypothetical protein LBB94_08820 [Clostridiales bacterium]|jgi:hypothetical protein|nr:hypothetical protein [Clostridiales bacterium]